jgi:hypothetical protein
MEKSPREERGQTSLYILPASLYQVSVGGGGGGEEDQLFEQVN